MRTESPPLQQDKLRVVLLLANPGAIDAHAPELVRHNLEAQAFVNTNSALAQLYEQRADVIVVDFHNQPRQALNFCRMVKRDIALAEIPIIALLPNRALLEELLHQPGLEFDDYLEHPADLAALCLRTRLCTLRGRRELDANPLTRLPGNTAIMKTLNRLLEQKSNFAVAYCDLDNFKSFNDKYGFARGDEVLRLTAKLIFNTVNAATIAGPSLVGHIGGDDFVFIVPIETVEDLCQSITQRFDLIVRTLYDEEDLAQHGIQSVNRKGESEFFPIMSISIAVVISKGGNIEHMGQISVKVGEIKKAVKNTPGSCYLIDRRR